LARNPAADAQGKVVRPPLSGSPTHPPYLGHLTIRNFTSRAREEWAAKRSPEIAASAYNHERDSIIAVLAYAKRQGMLLENPAEVLSRSKLPRVRTTTQAQFVTLIENCAAWTFATKTPPI